MLLKSYKKQRCCCACYPERLVSRQLVVSSKNHQSNHKNIAVVVLILFIASSLSYLGCNTPDNRSEISQKDHTIEQNNLIKTDLNGMTDKQIKEYFNQCIKNGQKFIYTGGIANTPIVDNSYLNKLGAFKFVSIGCTGGFEQAKKFNQLMIDYYVNQS